MISDLGFGHLFEGEITDLPTVLFPMMQFIYIKKYKFVRTR